jgi:hypothetical protein
MRPLSVLLPIAREYLLKNASTYPHDNSAYVCIAAGIAEDHGEISAQESQMLQRAISDALWYEGYKHATLYSKLAEMEEFDAVSIKGATDPRFYPIRDKWLDGLQKHFEQMNSACEGE